MKINFFYLRAKIREESSINEVMHWYRALNDAILNHMTNQIKETDKSGVWRYVL